MTVAAGKVALNILSRAFVDGLIDKNEKVISSKIELPNSRLDCKNHTLFMTNMAKKRYSFITKTIII